MSLFENEISLDDLNNEFKKLYKLTGEEHLINKMDNDIYLNKQRLNNYNLYNKLDIERLNKIPAIYKEDASIIFALYKKIDNNKLLKSDLKLTREYNKVIFEIINKLSDLNKKIEDYLTKITDLNNRKQLEIKKDIELLKKGREYKKIKTEYDNLVLSTASINIDDNISELLNQMNRYKKINSLKHLLTIKKKEYEKEENEDIINVYIEKLNYLKDLIPENSIHQSEFNLFVNSYSYIIDHYKENTNLQDKSKFLDLVKYYETKFMEERNNRERQEEFVFEKTGNKNLINSIEFILLNYKTVLKENEKSIIEYISSNISNLSIEYILSEISKIVNRLWDLELTNVLEYSPKSEFNFIVTDSINNEEFIKCNLLSSENYKNTKLPKIGYICSFNDNIVLINENIDINNIYDDLSKLKTIRELQKEFINFDIEEDILLNGYKTKIEGIYILNDGSTENYIKAVNLSNKYKLPLIDIKK